MFISCVFLVVFCLCSGLQLSFSSPQPEAREEVISAIFDYLENRLYGESEDNKLETDEGIKAAKEEVEEQNYADFEKKTMQVAASMDSSYEYGRFKQKGFKKRRKYGYMERNTLSKAQIDKIMTSLNAIRRNMAMHGGSNIIEMKWDQSLADLAEGYIQHCEKMDPENKHRGHDNLQINNYFKTHVSQNGSPRSDIDVSIKMWEDEGKHWNNETKTCDPGFECGHFYNVIKWNTLFVGCAFGCENKRATLNPDMKGIGICNFKALQRDTPYGAYKFGEACAGCGEAANCERNLCKCPNPPTSFDYCGKNGNWNPETCKCDCYYPRFTGDRCQNTDCSKGDEWYCGNYHAYHKWDCRGNRLARNACPQMCGFCHQTPKS